MVGFWQSCKLQVLGRESTTYLSIARILEEISDLAIGSLVFIFGMDLANDQSFSYIRSVYGDEVIVAWKGQIEPLLREHFDFGTLLLKGQIAL